MKNKIVKALLAASIIASVLMPVTTYAQSKENEAVVEEVGEDGKPFSVPGNGQLLEDISEDSTKQFITVQTKNNQTFFMVIDRAQSTENVYMLSLIDEDDLSEFLKDAKAADTGVVLPGTEEKPEEPVQGSANVPEETKVPQKKDNTNTLLFLVIGIFAVAVAAGYYFKIYKPKKDAADEREEGIEDDGYEYEDDSEEYDEPEEYEDDQDEYEDEDSYEDPDDSEDQDEEDYEDSEEETYDLDTEQDDESEYAEQESYEENEESATVSEDDPKTYEIEEDDPEEEPEPEKKPAPQNKRGHGRKNRMRYSR